MRDRILGRVQRALASRPVMGHPGRLQADGDPAPAQEAPERAGGTVASWGQPLADVFQVRFQESGGEVVRLRSMAEARSWLETFARELSSAAVRAGLPQALCPPLPAATPSEADLGVSLARYAVADTGTLLLDGREGRGLQLLPPVHLVWVPVGALRETLAQALDDARKDLPATLGLHSGPSKSADIGQVMVTGVHGPGRVVAAVLGEGGGGGP